MGIQVSTLSKPNEPWRTQFIDFVFNGKRATEMGVVAVLDGDRYSHQLTAEFENETNEVNGVNGQYYWGTRYKTRKRNFTLATDGITEEQLRAIKIWLRPGQYGELEEDAWLGRYCYVRLDSPATFKFIPFETEKEVMGVKLAVTEYKGEIEVTFIQDDPFCYARHRIFNNFLPWSPTDFGENIKLYEIYNNLIPVSYIDKKGNNCVCGNPVEDLHRYYNIAEIIDNNAVSNTLHCYNPSDTESEAIINMGIWHQFDKYQITNLDSNGCFIYPVYIRDLHFTNSEPNTRFKIEIKDANNKTKNYYFSLPDPFYSINKVIKLAWDFKQTYTEEIEESGATYIQYKRTYNDLVQIFKEEITEPDVLNWACYSLGQISAYEDSNGNKFVDKESNLFIEETTATLYFNPYYVWKNTDIVGSDGSSFTGNWFSYFNTMMLAFFASVREVDGEELKMPNLTHLTIINNVGYGDFLDYYHLHEDGYEITAQSELPVGDLSGIELGHYLLTLDGKNNSAKIKYTCNIVKNNIVKESRIIEKNCGDIMYSQYPLIEGGNKIDLDTGIIQNNSTIRIFNNNELWDYVSESKTNFWPNKINVEYEYKYF